jgi:acetoin utilization protein AcuC
MLRESAMCVYSGAALARYNFGPDHPFGPQRHDCFVEAFERRPWFSQVRQHAPVQAGQAEIEAFHTPEYVELVRQRSKAGHGLLDYGDTPAFPGVYEAAATVVGCGLHAVARIMSGDLERAFIPIAGLHHARRDRAAGFCVFNDCGVIIETLLRDFGIKRLAYVDIDAHHGDGVFYAFESDPRVVFADLHQDPRTLYPGTGFAEETGKGQAEGTKLNIPLPPGADDRAFQRVWPRVESLLRAHAPEIILLQCGADSIAGDPITALRLSVESHAWAARRLRGLADEYCDGRLLAMGGGGYNLSNIATAWTAVVEALV